MWTIAKRDPLIQYLGEDTLIREKLTRVSLKSTPDREQWQACIKLICSYLIEVIIPEMWPRVKEAAIVLARKSYRINLDKGSILELAAQFLRNQA